MICLNISASSRLQNDFNTCLCFSNYLPNLTFLSLSGNFIGKGGAHADGTKSSGDKVQNVYDFCGILIGGQYVTCFSERQV